MRKKRKDIDRPSLPVSCTYIVVHTVLLFKLGLLPPHNQNFSLDFSLDFWKKGKIKRWKFERVAGEFTT